MQLADLLKNTKERFLKEAEAGMRRAGIGKDEISLAIQGADDLLSDYNHALARAFGETIAIGQEIRNKA